VDVMTLWFL